MGSIFAAWMDVRVKPLRTIAAIAGMVAAVIAVILVDAANIVSYEANEIYLARKYGLPISVSISSEVPFTGESDRELEQLLLKNGVLFSPDAQITATTVVNGTPEYGAVRWISSSFNQIYITDLLYGEWPKVTADSDTLHLIVTDQMAGRLRIPIDQLVGSRVDVAWGTSAFNPMTDPVYPAVIDAVVSTDTTGFIGGNALIAIVSDRFPPVPAQFINQIRWAARLAPGDYSMVEELIQSVTDESGNPVYRMQRADQGDTLEPVLNQQQNTSRAVSAVALVIGGLGILSQGIASVRERAVEFGLRRALGANRLNIFTTVITTTLLEALFAALIAIPLAALLLELFARQLVLDVLPIPPATTLPLQSALTGLTAALSVGLIAGIMPALNAARSSVVQALRG